MATFRHRVINDGSIMTNLFDDADEAITSADGVQFVTFASDTEGHYLQLKGLLTIIKTFAGTHINLKKENWKDCQYLKTFKSLLRAFDCIVEIPYGQIPNEMRVRHATVSLAPGNRADVVAIRSGNGSVTSATTWTIKYYWDDADEEQGPTRLEDMITLAYKEGYFFRTEAKVSFTQDIMPRPPRFNEHSKYNRCLDLLNAAASSADRAALSVRGQTELALNKAASNIAEASMKYLSKLEGKPRSNKQTTGYGGVANRVVKVKRQNPDLK